MPILVTAIVKGQTQQGYDGMLQSLRDAITKAPGFIVHYSHSVDEGWVVSEIWSSKTDADTWYAKSVMPYLPPGIHPKRSYQELHIVVTAS
jgi:hypothetical protein